MPWDPLLRFKFWLWRRRCRPGKLKFETELATFLEYRNLGSLEFPGSQVNYPDRGESTRVAGAPLILRLQQWLMLQFRLTEEQAWDYPLGLAKCRWGCYWEENGNWSIYNEVEASLDQFAAQQDALRQEPEASKV